MIPEYSIKQLAIGKTYTLKLSELAVNDVVKRLFYPFTDYFRLLQINLCFFNKLEKCAFLTILIYSPLLQAPNQPAKTTN